MMNIEATTIAYLADLEIPVYAERPANPPGTYLLVEKTGAELVNFISQDTIVISAVAPSKFETSELCDELINAMMQITEEESDITACSLESAYDDTDTALKDYRYTAVFNISHY